MINVKYVTAKERIKLCVADSIRDEVFFWRLRRDSDIDQHKIVLKDNSRLGSFSWRATHRLKNNAARYAPLYEGKTTAVMWKGTRTIDFREIEGTDLVEIVFDYEL